jgi:hypothetical protein
VLAAIASATAVQGGLAEAHVLRTNQWIERDGARYEPLRADTRPWDGNVADHDQNKGTTDVQRTPDAGALAGVAAGADRAGSASDD